MVILVHGSMTTVEEKLVHTCVDALKVFIIF